MRPQSVVRFEQLYGLWLVLSIGSVVLGWPVMMADPNMARVLARMPWFPYAILLVMLALLVWLGLSISRRASNVGRWIFAILAGISVVLVIKNFGTGAFVDDASGWAGVAAAAVAVVAAVLTFRPDATAWFSPAAVSEA